MNTNLKEDLDFILGAEHKDKVASQLTTTRDYYMHMWSSWYDNAHEEKEDYARIDIFYDTISNWLYFTYVYRQNGQVVQNNGSDLTWNDVLDAAKRVGLSEEEIQTIQNFASRNPNPNC